jgi:hypothetical protein
MIDDSVCEADVINRPVVQAGVEALYASMGRGEHFVLSSRHGLARMLELGGSGATVRAVLGWCIKNYSFLAGLPSVVPIGLRVVAEGPVRVEDSVWTAPVEEFARAGVRPTVLLAENSVDARIFTHAARHFLVSKKLGEIQVRIEDRNGNGSGISTELKNLIQRRTELCLCIADSDRRAPEGKLGINAQQCEDVMKAADWPVDFRTTFGCELENDVPQSALDQVVSTRTQDWLDHRATVQKACGNILPFADLKKGTRPCDMKAFPAGTSEQKFWTDVHTKFAKALPANLACSGSGDCGTVKGCSLLPAAGEGIGAAVLEILERESSHASFKAHKSSENFEAWLELGSAVALHGLAPRPMRV